MAIGILLTVNFTTSIIPNKKTVVNNILKIIFYYLLNTVKPLITRYQIIVFYAFNRLIGQLIAF